jgi:2',3'-cyclic-nucleotide 2'-phosphodiesterase/3'-nucleotidase/5'-nucleotidase
MSFSGPASDSLVVTTRFTTAVPSEVPATSGATFLVGGNNLVSVLVADGRQAGTLTFATTETVNSVAVANGIVAVAVGVTPRTDPGQVYLFQEGTLDLLNVVTVGANPDNIRFTPDGTKLLVANEGEPNSYNQADSVDPEGSISVIDLSGGVAGATVATAGFGAFNGQADALRADGVRIFGPNATVAQDLEPEYIAISDDGTTAYVTLQENNALAIVDIATATVTDIVALGFKGHDVAGQGLDASDRDGPGNAAAINIATWPILGMYQPDAITSFSFNGTTYLATANEGDARDYTGFAEEVRISGLDLDNTVFPNEAAIKDPDGAGRLQVTNTLGDTDGDGDYDALYAFGARSFSIWSTDGTLVWDSGDAIERAIAVLDPDWTEPSDAERGRVQGLGDDTRSDNKGPEPEHIEFGTIGGDLYAFVGLERANGIMLFRLDESGALPDFEYQGVLHTQGDIGPEVFTVIDAADSESGNTEVLVANEVSGTTTLYEIEAPAQNFTLQILHASDLEAGLDATSRMGNFAAIIDRLEDEYANSLTLISGDAWIPGPFYAAEADPSLEAALEAFYGVNLSSGAQTSGRVSLAVMNAIEVDAANFGNHEFDLGTNAVRGIIAQSGAYPGAQFPYLSANLDFSANSDLSGLVVADGLEASDSKGKIAGTSVVTMNGERIGLVGATTQLLASISSPGTVTVIGDDVNDMDALAAILQPKIDALIAQGINKIIVQSHLQQYTLESLLGTKLSGVDIIISGGSNAIFADATDPLRAGDTAAETYPLLLTDKDGNPTLQVNTDGEYSYVGRLVVEFDDQGHIIPASVDDLVSGAYKTDDEGVAAVYGTDIADAFATGSKGARVDALADAVGAVISAQDGNTFGFTDVFLDGKRVEVRREETNLGSLSADANLWYAKQADATVTVSIKNGGGIRDSMGSFGTGAEGGELPPAANPDAGKEAGEVSQLDITNALRFNNTLSLLTLTAEELLAVLEHGVGNTTATSTEGRFPQIGGINFSWDISRAAGDRVLNATIVDEDGAIVDVLARDGSVVGDASREIRVVTLNFLAGGGDSYPFPALGSNRVDLINAGVRTGAVTFADDGSEQDALAEFLAANHATPETAYDTADTTPGFDTRNQQVAAREDTVEPVLALNLARDAQAPGNPEAQWRDLLANLDYRNETVAGEQGSSGATDSTGAALARFLSGDGDVDVREIDFASGASVTAGAGNAMTLDWQGRDAVLTLNAAWNSVKNARIEEFSGDALTVQNFVNVAVRLGADGDALPDPGRDLLIQGAKRAEIVTGDGSDLIVVETDSNEAGIWGNLVKVATNDGDDSVEITAASFDWSASFRRTPYDPAWTTSEANLGAGDDAFRGGQGSDRVIGGAGNDMLDGRGGTDTAMFTGSVAGYGITVLDAVTGLTRISGAEGVDEVVRFEKLAFADTTLSYAGGVWA